MVSLIFHCLQACNHTKLAGGLGNARKIPEAKREINENQIILYNQILNKST
jgi:hypothetical protein